MGLNLREYLEFEASEQDFLYVLASIFVVLVASWGLGYWFLFWFTVGQLTAEWFRQKRLMPAMDREINERAQESFNDGYTQGQRAGAR